MTIPPVLFLMTAFFAAVGLYGCVAHAGDLPDKRLTRGVADPTLTKQKICARGFHTASVRAVSAATKHQVYVRYGMNAKKAPCPCEVDHLIAIEVGGSNDIHNLWPQSFKTHPWNAHVKDDLENMMHKLMCTGKVTQRVAQNALSGDWRVSYKKYGGLPYVVKKKAN